MSTVDLVIQRDMEAARNYDLSSICLDETRLCYDDVMSSVVGLGRLYVAVRNVVIRAQA